MQCLFPKVMESPPKFKYLSHSLIHHKTQLTCTLFNHRHHHQMLQPLSLPTTNGILPLPTSTFTAMNIPDLQKNKALQLIWKNEENIIIQAIKQSMFSTYNPRSMSPTTGSACTTLCVSAATSRHPIGNLAS